jgi:hypothetical protein
MVSFERLMAIQLAKHFLVIGTRSFVIVVGRAVAQAVSRWLPNAAAQVRVRAACGVCGGQSSTEAGTSVSPANHHSTNFSIIIITRGWHNRPISGRNAEWTQIGLHPPLYHFFFIILLTSLH